MLSKMTTLLMTIAHNKNFLIKIKRMKNLNKFNLRQIKILKKKEEEQKVEKKNKKMFLNNNISKTKNFQKIKFFQTDILK